MTRPTRSPRPLLLVPLVVAALLGAVSPGPAGAAAAPTVLEPADLPRGSDVAVPHVEGTTYVDGDRRVGLTADRVGLVGVAGDTPLLRVSREDGSRPRVLRLLPDDSTELLLKGRDASGVRLDTGGRRLVQARATTPRSGPVTTVSTWDATTGRLVHRQALPGFSDLLGASGRRALLSDEARTFWLDLRTGRRSGVVARRGFEADLTTGRLATFDGDPFRGGCTVVSTLEAPRRATWRSCSERVESFSPDGRTMTTIDLLADGLGPGTVWMRTVRGKLLASWRTAWFGLVTWEARRTVLLETNGRRSAAVVRCTPAACENATDPGRVSQPRRPA